MANQIRFIVVLTAAGKPTLYAGLYGGLTPARHGAAVMSIESAEWTAQNIRQNAHWFDLSGYAVIVEVK